MTQAQIREVVDPPWAADVFGSDTVNGIPVRYRVAKGGRGSSKSWQFARELIFRAAQEPLTILCTRELQKSIKDSVHKLLVSQIEMIGLGDSFEWNKTQLTSKAGAEFLFYGLRHNPDEIKSLEGADICWLEEAQATSQDSIEMLTPTIRKPGSEIWVTYNPKFVDDPIHHMFVTEGRRSAIVKSVNWDENPWFPDVLRAEMEDMRRINPKLAKRIWDGEIIDVGGGDYFPSDKATVLTDIPSGIGRTVRAWDLAATSPSEDNPDPDYTAGVKMGVDSNGRVIVLDVITDRVNSDAVRRLVLDTAKSEPDTSILVPTDPGQSGKDQIEGYRRMLSKFFFKTKRPTGAKEVRAEGLSAQWHSGNVYLAPGPWNLDYLRSMNAFPVPDVHDDVVDASADAYSEIALGSRYTLSNL